MNQRKDNHVIRHKLTIRHKIWCIGTTIINVKTVERTAKAGAPFQRGTTYKNIVYLFRFILPMIYKNIVYSFRFILLAEPGLLCQGLHISGSVENNSDNWKLEEQFLFHVRYSHFLHRFTIYISYSLSSTVKG